MINKNHTIILVVKVAGESIQCSTLKRDRVKTLVFKTVSSLILPTKFAININSSI